MRPEEAKARGLAAERIVAEAVFQEALASAREWATRSFRTAKNAEEAWLAKCRLDAAEEFSAYLVASLKLGQAETAKLVRDRERRRFGRAPQEGFAEYMRKATEARKASA